MLDLIKNIKLSQQFKLKFELIKQEYLNLIKDIKFSQRNKLKLKF